MKNMKSVKRNAKQIAGTRRKKYGALHIRKTKNAHIKQKQSKLKHFLVGGAPDNILFGCTTLNNNSTLTVYFETINSIIRTYIQPEIVLTTFCVSGTSSVDKELETNTPKLIAANYIDVTTFEDNIINFLQTNERRYKMIVLSQCSSLLLTLFYKKLENITIIDLLTIRDLHEELAELPKPEINIALYDDVEQNLFLLYEKIIDNGYIINFYYEHDPAVRNTLNHKNDIKLVDITDINFVSPTELLKCIPFAIYTIQIINLLFTKIEEGVFQRKQGISRETYSLQCAEIKKTLTTTIRQIITDNNANIDKIDKMIQNDRDDWKKETLEIYKLILAEYGFKDIDTLMTLMTLKLRIKKNYINEYIIPFVTK